MVTVSILVRDNEFVINPSPSTINTEVENLPRPGQPAPLPPGLDLLETEFDPTPDAPNNLPM